MDFIQRMIRYFAVVRRQLRRHRRLVVAAAAVVVFATTYALVLPAITLDEQSASDAPGIELEGSKADAAVDVPAEEQAAEPAAEGAAAKSEPETEPADEGATDAQGDAADGEASADDAGNGDAGAAEPAGVADSVSASDQDGSYHVTVSYGAEAGIPEGAWLSVTRLDESSAEYAAAYRAVNGTDPVASQGAPSDEGDGDAPAAAEQEVLVDASGEDPLYDYVDDAGAERAAAATRAMDALDITIHAADGTEVEPADGSSVSVAITKSDAPADVDASELAASVEVSHVTGGTSEVVAGGDGAEGDVSAQSGTVTAEFETGGFSTYTISYGGYTDYSSTTVTVHYVDTSGKSLTPSTTVDTSTSGTYAHLIYDIDGYAYSYTSIDSTSGTRIYPMLRYLQSNNGYYYWMYQQTSGGTSGSYYRIYTSQGNKHDVYVVYSPTTAPTEGGTPTTTGGDVTRPNDLDKDDVRKESADNGDGTRTISLSVTGRANTSEQTAKANVIVVMDISGSMNGSYSDSDASSGERLSDAKTAITTMANTLLAKTDSQGNKLVKMELITFSRTATVAQSFTDDATTFNRVVNAQTASGGTNWEAALKLANEQEVDSDAATFVVFVSDGDPTYRIHRGNLDEEALRNDNANDVNSTYYRTLGIYGNGNSDPNDQNYAFALKQAQSIVGNDKSFYSIGVSNDVQVMSNLASQSGAGSGHYFAATDNDSLEAAFSAITNSVRTTLGFADVRITDGITAMTNLKGKAAGTTGEFTYSMTDSKGNAIEVPDELKTATYNSTTGAVEWNLPSTCQLLDGVTYKVSFVVWPDQDALDHVAKLNNGTETYESLSNEVKSQIKYVDGSYKLATNTSDANVKYKESSSTGGSATTSGDDHTVDYNTVDPLVLSDETVTIKKGWGNDTSHGTDPLTKDGVKITISGGDVSKELTLNSSNGWSATAHISAGFALTTTNDNDSGIKTLDVLEDGHDFTLSEAAGIETSEDISDYWELSAGTYRPMIINGAMTMLQAGSVDGATQYYIGKHVYSVVAQSDGTITATNTPKFVSITLRKTDDAGNPLTGAEFELTKLNVDERTYSSVSGVTNPIVVSSEGGVTVTHLIDGTYRLRETKAPSGYVVLTDPVEFTITEGVLAESSDGGNVMVVDDATKTVTVSNTPGTALPDTGGTGTTAFALAGAALATLALLGLALRRRSGRGDA